MSTSTSENEPNSEEFPTILDPKTCLQKGRCEVGNSRRLKPYKIYYELHGNSSIQAKKKMIFIMGLNNTFFSWSKQVEHFGKLDDHVVLVFDNRGVGNSDVGPERFFKTSGMAKDVIDLLDFIGWNQSRSINVIGVSMGGMIAQELCLQIPQRIVSVVFTSTQAGESNRLPPLSTTFGILRMLLSGGTPEERIARLVTKLFPAVWLDSTASDGSGKTNRQVKQEELVSNYYKRREQPTAGIIGQLSAAATHLCTPEVLGRLAKSVAPAKLVVLSGALDQVIDVSKSITLHENLPGSELVVLRMQVMLLSQDV
ncbi:soluble epoxide hydrolase [Melampsora larici-populina 98AG31]|uniref:Soluble epoxide hydrolase n=1 Tax=Melampsora larici-populina (strain 98AG31 / pathotype 3-4-7) TaxID=747676 RepID=F4RL42_MELLP|nr:soluble epoxide hydrolase [Melampsora larici-populina 98AG31]EGG06840.1 soluble epoxide hydrolase [Melampsora larici-populina 98AG31]